MTDSTSGRRGTRLAIAVLLLTLAFRATLARAAPATITGRVIDASDHRPVADQVVTLSTYRGDARVSTATTTTDGHGAFSFETPSSNATGFQLTTTYRRGTYRTPLTQIADPIPPVTLKVYSPTTDPAAIAQTNWVVWVDPMPGGIVVQQDLAWRNEGKTAYIGSRDGVVTEVPLSPGATNVQYLGLYLNGGGRVDGNTYRGTQPIVPGRSRGTVRYVVASIDGLHLVSPLATGSLHVFVPMDYVVSAPGMAPAGQITDRGTTYRVFTATNVPAERTMNVTLRPKPNSAGRAWPFAIAGLVILVLIAVVSALWIRRGRRRPRRADGPHIPPAREPSRDGGVRSPRGAVDDTELLLEEIAAIDIAFEEGLLEQAAYERVRAAAKERLTEAALHARMKT